MNESSPILALNNGLLPEGWAESTLVDLVSSRKGKKPKTLMSDSRDNLVPYILIDQMEGKPAKEFTDDKSAPIAAVSDILIVWDGSIGKTASGITGAIGSTIAALTPILIVTSYLESFLRLCKPYIEQNSRGSGLQHISPDVFWDIRVPLAPLAEQKRIVAKIEELLPLVNAAKEHLNRTSQIMKRFRQAVLSAACTGRLTEGWRKEHPNVESADQLLVRINLSRKERIGKKCDAHYTGTLIDSFSRPEYIENEGYDDIPSSWIWCRVSQIATVYIGGTPSRKQPSYWDGDIPWVSSGEVANCHIKTTREYITLEGLNNSSAKLYPLNTILIAMIGEGKTRGQAAILDIECCTNQNVAGVVVEAGVLPDYVWCWALSEYETNRSVGRGGSQPALNKQKVNELWLLLPPYEEQQEIVSRVEALFKLADTIEKCIETARLRADKLTQSILAKAFRGELVPTEAELARQEGRSYEPAAVLLERIKAEKGNASGSKRRTVRG